jgi:hypothetical protein
VDPDYLTSERRMECAECGGEIFMGQPVYRYKDLVQLDRWHGTRLLKGPTLDADPVCADCAPQWLHSEAGEGARTYTIRMERVVEDCDYCGRPVVFANYGGHWNAAFCSRECRLQSTLAKLEGKKLLHEMTCQECGAAFTSRRSDAKTCSSKCRQKAYRSRGSSVGQH